MTEERSNRWQQRHMRSFRVSEHLEEMIKQECKRRSLNFSSFIRMAALGALSNARGVSQEPTERCLTQLNSVKI
jgi:hypothetical protein